jgi:hypothetical protein
VSADTTRRRLGDRAGIALMIGFLVVTLGLFVGAIALSFQLLHGDTAPKKSDLPPIQIVGSEQRVFDWSEQGCSALDIPDAPARAFRGADGQVRLIASHYVTRADIGPSLDSVRHDCDRVMLSDLDGDPARFSDREWLSSPYTTDGRRVYALVHNEYQGDKHVGRCPSGDRQACWYNSITHASSADGGRTFSQRTSPDHLVASVPYRYQPGPGPYGLFGPSNIVYRAEDQHYYALIQAQRFGAQHPGTCVIRTSRLDRPGAWRAWDGESFSVRFANPYGEDVSASEHVCAPVSFAQIATMTGSLTFNTYLDKYVLVSDSILQQPRGNAVVGFYYSTSEDLIHWERRRLIHEAEMAYTYECGDPNPVAYPSLLDSDSPSRNFETTGRAPWLYFTRFHYKDCKFTSNRDLVRVRVRFSK